MKTINPERAVKQRYASAAGGTEAALCCPVDYDQRYLNIIPQEVIQKDYGCGNPAKFLKPGETVLDLGSGAGKICFIAAQVIGASGNGLMPPQAARFFSARLRSTPCPPGDREELDRIAQGGRT